ncbi:hypothetical protein ACUW6V_002170 [Cronobacter sp. 153480017-3]
MGWRGSQNLSLRNFLVFRNLQQFILHNFTRGPDTLAALITNRHEFTKLLEGLGMVLAYRLPYFFITDTVTQTNVHDDSRSVYAQSVNENSYDYNETGVEFSDAEWASFEDMNVFKLLFLIKQKRAPKRPFQFCSN